MPRTFLTARWEKLAMANYVVDPAILAPHLPAGVELDFWEGRAYVSLVGFLFLDTRVRGLGIPFHRNFEEVNLRFYVRRRTEDGWRRGVVFIKEIVPRIAIAAVANALYGEHYICLPMKHTIVQRTEALQVGYAWKFHGDWNHIQVTSDPEPQPLQAGSEAAFITEHYWGYTRRGEQRTSSYRVEHPSWRVYEVHRWDVQVDVARLYGESFAPFLAERPASVFLAEGSEVGVGVGVVAGF